MAYDENQGAFTLDDLDTLRQVANQLFQIQFGMGIDLDDAQTPGMLAAILASIMQRFEQELQATVNNFFVLLSNGQAVDDHGVDEDIYRKVAQYSYVNLQIDCYVDSPTIIPDESEFSTNDGHIFKIIDGDVTVSTPAFIDDGKGNVTALTDEDGQPLGRVSVQAQSLETGYSENVLPNTITNAEQSIDGVVSVTNPEGSIGGTDAESDDLLKKRIIDTRVETPAYSPNGVVAALKNLPDVTDVKLVNNRKHDTDKYGNPGKSVHVYVVGGDHQEIAQALCDHLYPTTQTMGNISVPVSRSDGISENMQFDTANAVPIYVTVDLNVDENMFDFDNGINAIKQNITNYFDTIRMGDNVVYSKLFAPIYQQSGVEYANIKISKDNSVFVTTDLSFNDFDLPIVNDKNIIVNLNKVGD
ncbi:baseplate J/gp47 family protein [Nicoliella lavandulae]|uniref:Baseplate J/gp47 family protein n=1 Tax=Nicoliella lavandulae TaxID=3082954 RepID=A0ABU8SMC1_9LACO